MGESVQHGCVVGPVLRTALKPEPCSEFPMRSGSLALPKTQECRRFKVQVLPSHDEMHVLARGTWNGTALTNVETIFESGATDTEASRIAFGRDGMLYMSISAPGSPKVQRSQDPNDYAGKTVRLRDDGSIPGDNPFVGRTGFKPGIFTSGHRNGHGLAVNPETGDLWEP